jgi:cysteinyl-tRNA synthetase
MEIKLYNTLTRKKETFKPIEKGKVGIYSCGPTVYWYQHIGNLKAYVFSDLLKRMLLFNDYKVKHVMNVTDVGHLTSDADSGEDKMEKASKKEGKSAKEIAEYYLNLFKDDFKKLNIIEPDIWCKATEHIKEQINLIKKLEEKGFTYKTSDGIYFDSSKFKKYGKLAKLDIKGLQAGKRIDLGEKKNKTDFALWKFSEEDSKRQQEWKSPWGIGFPGWHIECSAMSMQYLGENFDIHTGGIDHIPIHHTNEIAQSEAATGKPFVNYWMHQNFLTFKGEKVSKSSGGLFTLSQLEEKGFLPLDYRYLLLGTQYRNPVNFTIENLTKAKESLERLKNIISSLQDDKKENKEYLQEFQKEINDDLNTPNALQVLWRLVRDEKATGKINTIKKIDEILGLDLLKVEEVKIPKKVSELVKKRNEAREKKDWKSADKIRDEIKNLGYSIDDTSEGTKIKKI